MTDKNTGGPAYPIETTATPYAPGMSLRDWFAGQALGGIMATLDGTESRIFFDEIAADCYRAADAMLKEREK